MKIKYTNKEVYKSQIILVKLKVSYLTTKHLQPKTKRWAKYPIFENLIWANLNLKFALEVGSNFGLEFLDLYIYYLYAFSIFSIGYSSDFELSNFRYQI